MDNKSTTKRMIGAVVLVLIAALLLAWLLKGKNPKLQPNQIATAQQTQQAQPISGFPGVSDPNALPPAPSGPSAPPALVADAQQSQAALAQQGQGAMSAPAAQEPVAAPNADLQTAQAPTPDNVTTFEIRPGESRAALDKNGAVVEATGSMGGDAVVASGTANPDENQPASSNAVTNTTEANAQNTNAAVANTEAQPKSLVDGAPAATNEAATATGVVAATTKANEPTAPVAKQPKEVQPKEILVAKPNVAATNPSGKPVTITATTPAKVAQPRLVNERPVPEVAMKSQANAATPTKKPVEESKATTQKVPSVEALTAEAAKRNGYVIQVLATADRAKADTIRQTIATDGYPAFIAQGVANGKRVYRVRIGTYKAKSDAVSVQSRMKMRYGQNQLVQNSFVTNNN